MPIGVLTNSNGQLPLNMRSSLIWYNLVQPAER